ncbi:hypothetical protein ACOMHN_007126 [Nucella lapillus]
MAEEGFDSRMKLKMMRSMIPEYQRYLVPSRIMSDLTPYVLNEDQMREIEEKERQSSRPEAVRMLLEAVLAKKEDGLSYFINALKQGNHNNDRFLNSFEDTPTEQNSNHPEVNEYFSFIIRCLEGEITRGLTSGEFKAILRHLLSDKVIDEQDMEESCQQTVQKGVVHLFRLLPQNTAEWPLKFFRALNSVKPEMVTKCDPQGESPYEEVDKAALMASQEGNPEETSPKRVRISAAEESSEEVTMETEEDLLASDEDDIFDFSDDEEKEDAGTEKTAQPKPLSMRKYQYELAARALNGENTIICAPTGSGKTRVALYIVKEHLKAAGSENRKVVFMARTVPLVSQQFKIFEKFLPDCRCGMYHGETADHDVLHLMLDDFDILVMTPKILENHLAHKKILSLSVFSLMIFDECHHTRKGEPYNSVMKHYLQFKKDGQQDLPQIIGLTASIGVEKASTVDAAQTSIINIMANLDVKSITTVEENQVELIMTVPTPDEDLVELTLRADDEVSKAIHTNMMHVERLLNQQVPLPLKDQEFESVSLHLRKRPAGRNSQKYGQWAVKVCDQARKVHIPERPDTLLSEGMIERRRLFSQNVQLLAETLIAYNEALDVHELGRPVDVLEHLKNKLDPRHSADSPTATQLEIDLLNLFKSLQKKLKSAEAAKNPNLRKLSAVIEEQMEGQWDQSRVMIFVRTRATCQALCSWLTTDLNLSPQLRRLKASPFTGTGAHQEHGGMTQSDQEGVIEKFRAGDVKLLVCTTVGQEGMDIPDCNLVIRYNHVGNEVGTVQTRGRCRKAGGMSMLLAMPEVIRKERLNKKRVQIMNQAIDKVRLMRHREVTNEVIKAQKQAMDKDEMKKIASMKTKSAKTKQGKFMLACARCRKVLVPGSCIRTINNDHHVVVGYDLVEKQEASIKYRSKPKQVHDMQFIGELVCSKCPVMKQNVLGSVMKYQEADFHTLKAEGWLVLDEQRHVQKSGKWKWKDIHCDYPIPEMTPRDMSLHLGLLLDPEEEGDEEEGAVGGTSD